MCRDVPILYFQNKISSTRKFDRHDDRATEMTSADGSTIRGGQRGRYGAGGSSGARQIPL